MVCLGHKPGAARLQTQTNPLSYGGTPEAKFSYGSFSFEPRRTIFVPTFTNVGLKLQQVYQIKHNMVLRVPNDCLYVKSLRLDYQQMTRQLILMKSISILKYTSIYLHQVDKLDCLQNQSSKIRSFAQSTWAKR